MLFFTGFYLLLSIVMLAIPIYMYRRQRSVLYSRLLILTVAVSIWLLPFGIVANFPNNLVVQTWLLRISTMAASLHPMLIFQVIDAISSRGHSHSRIERGVMYALTAITFILDATPWVIESVIFSGDVEIKLGPVATPLAVVFGSLYFYYPLRIIINNFRATRGKEHIQMKYMALGLAIALSVAFTTNTILPVFFGITTWYLVGSGVCIVAVVLILYGINEERLYDLDLFMGPIFRTRKYEFHLMLNDFISKLPYLFSYEKIVVELSRLLGSRVAITLFDKKKVFAAEQGKVLLGEIFREELRSELTPDQFIHELQLGVGPQEQRLKKILQKHGIETVVPIAHGKAVTGMLTLGRGSSHFLYSKQDFEQLLKLCDQLSMTSHLIHQKDQMIVEKEQEIHRLSEAISRLKPAVVSAERLPELDVSNMNFDESFPLIGDDRKMRGILEQVRTVAKYDTSVLITGETGTGKENLARFIHAQSGRTKFVAVNCSAIPEHLLESELFGYRRGAFTGADRNKTGLLVEADGGTLFLDEVGDLPLPLQAKLLRVLQDGAVQPLGDVQPRFVDVRLIAATNAQFENRLRTGQFREDLYHRIRVIHFEMPALRERGNDLILLAHFFLHRFNRKYKKHCQISDHFIHQLRHYRWPGNVREMENMINRAVCLAQSEATLNQLDLPQGPSPVLTDPSPLEDQLASLDLGLGLKEIVERAKREIILTAIRRSPSQKEAADLLKLKPSNLSMYLKKYNITSSELH